MTDYNEAIAHARELVSARQLPEAKTLLMPVVEAARSDASLDSSVLLDVLSQQLEVVCRLRWLQDAGDDLEQYAHELESALESCLTMASISRESKVRTSYLLGRAAGGFGRVDTAAIHFERALEGSRSIWGQEDQRTFEARSTLVACLLEQAKWAEAESLAHENYRIAADSPNLPPVRRLEAVVSLARALGGQKATDEAKRLIAREMAHAQAASPSLLQRLERLRAELD